MSKALIRLDKFLADRTEFSRSQIKQKLKKELVTVNGRIITSPEYKIAPDIDQVCFDSKELSYSKFSYYMLNKPAGVVSATTDNHDQTVLSLLPVQLRKNLFPVGRLDKDTEGLLLLTDDGALAHELLSPKKHVDKTYFVTLEHPATERDVSSFLNGIDIGEAKLTLPAELQLLEGNDCLVTIREGKFHQIKRMFHACGNEVKYLKRLSMGTLTLDAELPIGNYRPLTEAEIYGLRECSSVYQK